MFKCLAQYEPMAMQNLFWRDFLLIQNPNIFENVRCRPANKGASFKTQTKQNKQTTTTPQWSWRMLSQTCAICSSTQEPFVMHLKPWPNGVASRPKFSTCMYLRVRLARVLIAKILDLQQHVLWLLIQSWESKLKEPNFWSVFLKLRKCAILHTAKILENLL